MEDLEPAMQKRYQVFVSSTFDDLKEERSKVITALLDLGHIPCGMEYFPAADEDAWHCIERLIPQCDYYVVLVAGRYGSIPKGESKSYTHKEYELAIENEVPVLALLHARPSEIPKKHCESDPKIQKKLDQFRVQVQRKLCRFWTTADQIPGELLASLTHQISRVQRTGWVRADTIASDDAKNEIISLNKKLEKAEKLVAQLKTARDEQDANFASGDDELRLFGTVRNRANYKFWGFSGDDDESSPIVEIPFCLVSTWNLLIRHISTHKCIRWGSADLERWLDSEVRGIIESDQTFPEREKLTTMSVAWNSDEIYKATNQLQALGLIALGAQSKWAFTSKGQIYASRQLALRKGELTLKDSEWCRLEVGKVKRQMAGKLSRNK